VIATNIAESSVTIDDIVYVVDCGRAKIKMFDPQRNFATLKPEWISQERQQRPNRTFCSLIKHLLWLVSGDAIEKTAPATFFFT
jgi:hypothetical protein